MSVQRELACDAWSFAFQFPVSGVTLMSSVMTVVHRWSVASCKLGYCLGVLLQFAQLLLLVDFVQPTLFGNFCCSVPANQQVVWSD
jgi:hypothetical protein